MFYDQQPGSVLMINRIYIWEDMRFLFEMIMK